MLKAYLGDRNSSLSKERSRHFLKWNDSDRVKLLYKDFKIPPPRNTESFFQPNLGQSILDKVDSDYSNEGPCFFQKEDTRMNNTKSASVLLNNNCFDSQYGCLFVQCYWVDLVKLRGLFSYTYISRDIKLIILILIKMLKINTWGLKDSGKNTLGTEFELLFRYI